MRKFLNIDRRSCLIKLKKECPSTTQLNNLPASPMRLSRFKIRFVDLRSQLYDYSKRKRGKDKEEAINHPI